MNLKILFSILLNCISIFYFYFTFRSNQNFLIPIFIYFILSILIGKVNDVSIKKKLLIVFSPIILFIFIASIIDYYLDTFVNLLGFYELFIILIINTFIVFKVTNKPILEKKTFAIFLFLVTINILFVAYIPTYYFYFHILKKVNNIEIDKKKIILTTINQQKYSFEKFESKIIILDFWDKFCGSCIYQLRELKILQERYKDNAQVKILAINPSTDTNFEEFIGSKHVKLFGKSIEMLFDNEQYLSKLLNVYYVPQLYIIDKKGKIRYYIKGYAHQSDNFVENMSNVIEQLLKEK